MSRSCSSASLCHQGRSVRSNPWLEQPGTGSGDLQVTSKCPCRAVSRSGRRGRRPPRQAAGLYAWRASPDVLPALRGRRIRRAPSRRYYRSASRRSFEAGWRTIRTTEAADRHCDAHSLALWSMTSSTARWTDRVVLVDDERRLTEWTIGHLLVMWCGYATPRDVEQQSSNPFVHRSTSSTRPAFLRVSSSRRRFGVTSLVLRTSA